MMTTNEDEEEEQVINLDGVTPALLCAGRVGHLSSVGQQHITKR
jgi:hypothetical protein